MLGVVTGLEIGGSLRLFSLQPCILKHKNFIVLVLPLKAKQLHKCHAPSPSQVTTAVVDKPC